VSPAVDPSWESIVVGAALFATMAAYALFAGADFGGGIWDLLAGGSQRGAKPREEIDRSVTPVWEGNNVWIVLGFTLVWTAFPTAFAAIMTALFIPLSLSLLGIFCRGVGFAFRHEAERLPMKRLSGALFAASSFLAPFFLGDAVGAVATGRVRTDRAGNVISAWVSPAALMTGVLFVSTCAYIGAVYLVADTGRRGEAELVRYFSRRALAAGVVTGLLAGINLLLLRADAPYVWHRLLHQALPLVLASVLAGIAALVLVLLHRRNLLRVCAAIAVAAVVGAYGIAQYPWLLPQTLDLRTGSAPNSSLVAILVVLGLALVLVVPSFAYLYLLQQTGRLQDTPISPELQRAVTAENQAADGVPSDTRSHPVVMTVLFGAAVLELGRDMLRRRSARR
jgi:cytochrome bd ubiquinol oxidase subunit II